MKIFVCVVAAIQFAGCAKSLRDTPTRNTSTLDSREGLTTLFSQLMLDHLGTRGDFEADYAEAKEYLGAVEDGELTSRDLSKHVENTYRIVRTIWASNAVVSRKTGAGKVLACPGQLIQQLVALRFLRNASQIKEARNRLSGDYLQLAKQSLNGGVLISAQNRHHMIGFVTIMKICMQFNLSDDCPSYSLRVHTALSAIRVIIDTVSTETTSRFQLLQPTNRVISFIVAVRLDCQKNTSLIRQRLFAFLNALQYILQVPPESVLAQPEPIAELVNLFNAKIKLIDETTPDPHC